MEKTKFQAGFSEADITPEGRKVELAGQYYSRVSEVMHSRLKAVALYLESGVRRAVMVSLDVVGVPDGFFARVKKKISENIPDSSPVEVIINATHTHNAPLIKMKRKWWKFDPEAITAEEFADLAESKIIEAVKAAYAGRKPAGIAFATGYASAGHPRRAVYAGGHAEMYGDTSRDDFIGMEGGEDSGAEFMFFFDEKRQPFGLVVNAACPSQVMEATRVVSSDYMGALREKLKEVYGVDFRTICQISSAGCQSPRDLTRKKGSFADFWGEKGVEIISDRLLKTAGECLESVKENIDFSPLLSCESVKTPLPIRRVSYNEYLNALREKERLEKIMDRKRAYEEFCKETAENENSAGRLPPYDDKLHHFVQIEQQKAIIERYKEQFESPFLDVDICCIRLGGAFFATNPFELFLSYGQMIKARSRAQSAFIVQLANGTSGYLPTAAAEALKGYGGLVMNGKVGSEGGFKLVEDTLKTINALFENG